MSQILHARSGAAATPPVLDLLEQTFAERNLEALGHGGAAARVPRAAWEAALLGPARELLSRPGKGFREALVRVCWRIGGGGEMPAALPLIIEIIHAGSLIIDDVEDDSSLRRGGACLHRLYGVPVAVNVGNWMYFWALEQVEALGLPAPRAGELRRVLTQAMFRCHFGQALDLSRPVGRIPQGEMAAIVAAATDLKTGALMELAARTGAIAAGADAPVTEALALFGRRLGRGLQMLDDLGNLAASVDGGDEPKRHEDLRLGRPTWAWAWLAETLDQISFASLQSDARMVQAHALAGRKPATEPLAAALRGALGLRGRRLARLELARAIGDLAKALGPLPEIPLIGAEIARLEAAYG